MATTATKKSRKPEKHHNFTMFFNEIIDSNAFKALGNSARVVYLLLLRQKNGRPDQPTVKFPYKDARKYLNGSTFSKAINDLVRIGFIDLEVAVKIGSDIRQPNVYLFSHRWKALDIQMVDSKRYPKSRTMKNPKTGRFTPKIRIIDID